MVTTISGCDGVVLVVLLKVLTDIGRRCRLSFSRRAQNAGNCKGDDHNEGGDRSSFQEKQRIHRPNSKLPE